MHLYTVQGKDPITVKSMTFLLNLCFGNPAVYAPTVRDAVRNPFVLSFPLPLLLDEPRLGHPLPSVRPLPPSLARILAAHARISSSLASLRSPRSTRSSPHPPPEPRQPARHAIRLLLLGLLLPRRSHVAREARVPRGQPGSERGERGAEGRAERPSTGNRGARIGWPAAGPSAAGASEEGAENDEDGCVTW